MKVIFHILAMLAVVEGRAVFGGGGGGGSSSSKSKNVTCEAAGGPGGEPFADDGVVSVGQTLTEITLCSAERLDGIGYTIVSAANEKKELFHGSRKKCRPNPLAANEHITSYELHIANRHLASERIGHIKLMSTENKIYEGGKPNKQVDNTVVCTAPPGQRFGGFSGRAGAEVDALKPIWTPLPV